MKNISSFLVTQSRTAVTGLVEIKQTRAFFTAVQHFCNTLAVRRPWGKINMFLWSVLCVLPSSHNTESCKLESWLLNKQQSDTYMEANMAAAPLLIGSNGSRLHQRTIPLNSNSKSRQEVKRLVVLVVEEEGSSLVRWERRRRSDKGWMPRSQWLTATIEQSSPICLVGRYAAQCASWKGSFQWQELKCFTQVTIDRDAPSAFQSFPPSRQSEWGRSALGVFWDRRFWWRWWSWRRTSFSLFI